MYVYIVVLEDAKHASLIITLDTLQECCYHIGHTACVCVAI